MKYLGINLTKYIWDLGGEYHKASLSNITDHLIMEGCITIMDWKTQWCKGANSPQINLQIW